MDLKELLGEDYSDEMTVTELQSKLNEKQINLVNWNDDKHIAKKDYIELEHKYIDLKNSNKDTIKELKALKEANMSDEEKQNAEKQGLLDRIASLELEKSKSEVKAMYSSMGYSDEIVKGLVDIEFYDGVDKLAKKQELLKSANEEMLANYKKSVMEGDRKPNSNPNSSISKVDEFKAEYQKALNSDMPYTAAAVIQRASEQGIDINLLSK